MNVCFLFSLDNIFNNNILALQRKRKWINKRRHWQYRNNYTPLHPIYINKRSLGKREGERLKLWFKSFFRPGPSAFWSMFMAASVFHIVHEIFCFVWPGLWLVSHSAGLIQCMYPGVTLTIHLWPVAPQHQGLNMDPSTSFNFLNPVRPTVNTGLSGS